MHSSNYIETTYIGELVGLDLMEYQHGYIVVPVDYFSRKVFAKYVQEKTSSNILNYLEEIYNEFKFDSIISDCGKEFEN